MLNNVRYGLPVDAAGTTVDGRAFKDITEFKRILLDEEEQIARNLTEHLQKDLHQSLGKEIVQAQLNLETMVLKAETAAQVFGRTTGEIRALAAKSGRTLEDFQTFFLQNLMNESDAADLKKAWKASAKKK